MNEPQAAHDLLLGGRPLAQGVVMNRTAGFYTVRLADGQEVVCWLRGRVRKVGAVLVGDRVTVSLLGGGRGAIEEVHPRTSCLVRPPVANVTRVVATVALAQPPPDLGLLDRLLVLCEAEGLSPVVCFTKADLVDSQQAAPLARIYSGAGYPVAVTSVVTGQGLGELARELAGHVSTLSGPSGVGKSALINALCPQAGQATGEVSAKLGRGRHTTRTVRLLSLPGGGLLADTPGFSRLELDRLDSRQLSRLMPDIDRLSVGCRFAGRCLHTVEPGCAVREAARSGRLAASRYRHYLRLLEEITAAEGRRFS